MLFPLRHTNLPISTFIVCSQPPPYLLLPLLLCLSWKIETRSWNLVIALDSSHTLQIKLVLNFLNFSLSFKSFVSFSTCRLTGSSPRSFSSPPQTFMWVRIACYVYERWISNLGDKNSSLEWNPMIYRAYFGKLPSTQLLNPPFMCLKFFMGSLHQSLNSPLLSCSLNSSLLHTLYSGGSMCLYSPPL